MKNQIILLLLLLPFLGLCQKPSAGDYQDGLRLAYDPQTNKLSGYFESGTGWDEKNQSSRFSCIFYIEGIVSGNKIKIKTYFPTDNASEYINGTLEIVDSKTIRIKLDEEHGGCWNVQHFADKVEKYSLEQQHSWMQIRYVTVDKAYFHKAKSTKSRMKSYLIKSNFVCIEKIEGDWAYCTFFGDKTTKGWLKTSELNPTKT